MGVGIATAAFQFISAFFCFIYANKSNSYIRLENSDFNFSPEIFFKVVKIGIPIALQNTFIAISLIALQRVVNEFGPDLVTAYTIVLRIELFVQYPFMSLGIALANYIGQNLGAEKEERVKIGFIRALLCTSAFSIFIFIMFQSFAPIIVNIFGNDPSVVKYSVIGLKTHFIFF